jgi:RNA polymerase sigma-70 factor (ECF subfamily)
LRQDSDEQLVRRFQRGDMSAFESFIERHQDRIHRLASAWLYSPDAAADAAQDVFLRALTGLPRFRFRATPFTWLYRTLRNVCHEYNRRSADRPLSVEERDLIVTDESPRKVDNERRLERLLARVATLPERQREVLMLRIFEDMSVEDTARTLGCRPGTVKAQLSRALGRLRALESADEAGADSRSGE